MVIARKYRPQRFKDVFGQDAIVTTLKNAIKRNSLAYAYLFCGTKGTGKTTLARILAKALNCVNPSDDCDPCNECFSCKEITGGRSLDILEIDGASHRGIDDIRQINDTVGYSTASGKYKIFIIDEVHMLTKEAFNALLKTLEEPPPKVKFLFATTEPHKVLPTILSRCQRFNLNRIPVADIIQKLKNISTDLGIEVDEGALRILAHRADGSLRDAESLLDQILAFQEGTISESVVSEVLGMMPKECFFELDRAGKAGELSHAFAIADLVFSQGKDISYFMENLIEHFRNILMVKLTGKGAPFLLLSDTEKEHYELSAKIYSREQCMTILDFLIEAQGQRAAISGRIALEAILLRILRIHQRIPVDVIVRRLADLEKKLGGSSATEAVNAPAPIPKPIVPQTISEDPTPTLADLAGIPKSKKPVPAPLTKVSMPIETGARLTPEAQQAATKQQGRIDTLLQFAAIELEGTMQRKR